MNHEPPVDPGVWNIVQSLRMVVVELCERAGVWRREGGKFLPPFRFMSRRDFFAIDTVLTIVESALRRLIVVVAAGLVEAGFRVEVRERAGKDRAQAALQDEEPAAERLSPPVAGEKAFSAACDGEAGQVAGKGKRGDQGPERQDIPPLAKTRGLLAPLRKPGFLLSPPQRGETSAPPPALRLPTPAFPPPPARPGAAHGSIRMRASATIPSPGTRTPSRPRGVSPVSRPATMAAGSCPDPSSGCSTRRKTSTPTGANSP